MGAQYTYDDRYVDIVTKTEMTMMTNDDQEDDNNNNNGGLRGFRFIFMNRCFVCSCRSKLFGWQPNIALHG